MLSGIRDLEKIDMFELGFVKPVDNRRGTADVSIPSKSRMYTGTGPGARFSNTGTDPRERVFYMNSVTSLDKTDGKNKLRLVRVGEHIEKGVESTEGEQKEQQRVQAFLTDAEKAEFVPLAERLDKSIENFKATKKHFVSGIVSAQFGHNSPRAKIHKSVENSKEQLQMTKLDHSDSIQQKTPKEIMDFIIAQVDSAVDLSVVNPKHEKKPTDDTEVSSPSKLSLEPSSHLLSELETDLFSSIELLTRTYPDPAWTPRSDLIYSFEPPKNVVNGVR